ncbi:MAG: hypothetical protein NTY19_44205 [Planctomycetota bacterium]|nr:hypothetical protein [Planctomycetota bacterium]
MTQSDEDKLADLLRRRRQTSGVENNGTKRLEREIVDLVYRHLYTALRPQFFRRYGTLMDACHASTRFTEQLNEFFVKVLGRFSDTLAKLETAQDLRRYSARAMTNLLNDHFRHAKHERPCDEEMLEFLVEERQRELQQDGPELRYAEVLDQVATWDAGSDERLRRFAELIQRQYVSGDERDAIERDLGISTSEFYRLRAEAFEELHRRLSV